MRSFCSDGLLAKLWHSWTNMLILGRTFIRGCFIERMTWHPWFVYLLDQQKCCVDHFKQHFIYVTYLLVIFHLTVYRHYMTQCHITFLFNMKCTDSTGMLKMTNNALLLLLVCGRIQWYCTHEYKKNLLLIPISLTDLNELFRVFNQKKHLTWRWRSLRRGCTLRGLVVHWMCSIC